MDSKQMEKTGYVQVESHQMISAKKDANITETGALYLLKKSLYKQALFWTSLVFGAAACFFFMATMAFLDENNAIHRALAYYGMYYDHETLVI